MATASMDRASVHKVSEGLSLEAVSLSSSSLSSSHDAASCPALYSQPGSELRESPVQCPNDPCLSGVDVDALDAIGFRDELLLDFDGRLARLRRRTPGSPLARAKEPCGAAAFGVVTGDSRKGWSPWPSIGSCRPKRWPGAAVSWPTAIHTGECAVARARQPAASNRTPSTDPSAAPSRPSHPCHHSVLAVALLRQIG